MAHDGYSLVNCRTGAQHRPSTGSPCGEDSCPRRAGSSHGAGTGKARGSGKQCGFDGAGWREAAGAYGEDGSFRSVADIVSPETLLAVRENKRAAKAAASRMY